MFHDRIAEARFAELQREYGFALCVETGTHLGCGALRASQYCDVLTIDLNDDFRRQAKEGWLREDLQAVVTKPDMGIYRHSSHLVVSLLGNSSGLLPGILAECGDAPLCLYLDAHWNDYWPLRDELKAIARHRRGQDVVIIHDCKVPGKDFLFDSYSGQDLCYEYVADLLTEINPGYRIGYNEACDPRDEPYASARGILYALPQASYCPRCKKWAM